jgi:putative restriction endonuclease
MHKLFDAGYLTVTPDYYVEVSRRIKDEFENRLIYYLYDRKKLVIIPYSKIDKPGKDYLEWHNGQVYR